MPASTPAQVRKQIASGKLDVIYLIVGDDEAEMSRLAADLSAIVEDELRAFNVERIYASDKSSTAVSIAEAARQLPMMAPRRVVVVLRAEKLLKPKRKGKAGEVAEAEEAGPGPDVDALEAYVKSPEPQTVLIFVASDIDRTRRLSKALQKQATIVECWGLKGSNGRASGPEAGGAAGRATGSPGGGRRGTADRPGGVAAGGRARRNGHRAASRRCQSRPAFFDDPFFRREVDPSVIAVLENPARQEEVRKNRAAQTYKKQLEVARRNAKALIDAGVRLASGTDSGPAGRFQGYFEHLELEELVKAGLTPMQAIVAATGDAAACVGLGDRVGSLQAGLAADFLVLGKNPADDIRNTRTIESVWINSNLVPAR